MENTISGVQSLMVEHKEFGRHRKEAIRKMQGERKNLQTQVNFLPERKLQSPATTGDASECAPDSGKKRRGEGAGEKFPKRSKKRKKDARHGPATQKKESRDVVGKKAVGMGGDEPNNL